MLRNKEGDLLCDWCSKPIDDEPEQDGIINVFVHTECKDAYLHHYLSDTVSFIDRFMSFFC